jgi:hypothetical protein
MTRDEIIEIMAAAMHEYGYTDPFESLPESSKKIRRDEAEAALEALEEAGLIEVDRWYR